MAEAPRRYCGNCGNELSPDDRFCPNCGTPVHQAARVPTPEADVAVPPPPQAGGGAAASPQQPAQEGFRQRHPILFGCLTIVGLLVVLVIVAAAFGVGDETAGGGNGGGGGQASDQDPVEAEDSGETFTSENYPELVSDPESHEGAKVDITGQIFTAPEIVEGDTAFQMYADPENLEWNTAVLTQGNDPDLDVDDYVHVVGSVAGQMEGENLMGGTVTAVMVEADEVDVVSGVEAVDPTQKTMEVGRTLADQGFGVTLKKIEFGEDTTRVYVSVQNGTGTGASFYDYDAKIIQGSRQFDQETNYDYEVKAPQSDLRPGVRTDGVVTFGKVDPSKPLEVRFEWYSDNYNVNAHPIVFQVRP